MTKLRVALGELPAPQRPHLIRVVDEIPVSDSYRPMATAFAREGVPQPGAKVWYRDVEGRYRRYTRSSAAKVAWNGAAPTEEAGEATGTIR